MNKTLFRSEAYYDWMIDEEESNMLTVEVMTGAELSAMRYRHANDNNYTQFETVVSDSDLDFNADYQITYFDQYVSDKDMTTLTAAYIEIEIKKLR